MGISTDKRLKGNISTPEIKGGQIVLTGPRGVGIEKIEKTTSSGVEDTYTITYTDGQTSNFIVKNGLPLEFNWDGTKLGIRVQGQTDYSYTDLKGSKGDTGAQGPKGEQGKAFTYDMFTEEQLKALTGPKGEQGAPGKDAPNMYKYKQILTSNVAKRRNNNNTMLLQGGCRHIRCILYGRKTAIKQRRCRHRRTLSRNRHS